MKIQIQSHNILPAAKHIKVLGEMFGNDCANPYATYETLLTAERKANRKACQYCNGEISCEEWEKWGEKFVKNLAAKLGLSEMPSGFFLNGDPRGYALKMKEGTFPDGLTRDFGGYGILGADFS